MQSVPPRAWQQINAEGAKLRVAATFQDDVEIFSITSGFPSTLTAHLAEAVTLIGTYIQMEGEMRITQVDVRRPFDVIKLLVARISLLVRGAELWETESKKMRQEKKELIAQKDELKAKNATLQDRIVILEQTRLAAEAENEIELAKQYRKTLKQTLK